ncbi:TPA: DNA primase [Candidatus Woesearchaeota archaeon]|nr:DNA primase [Candidatus Woesearchaeota archaeon]
MGKISPVSAKYIVHTTIQIDGIVDRPDVIGAIFGQTEGLLGNELELRELQRSGRIGRIEVNVNTNSGRTVGEIIIPSSLDKTETAIVAAALEIIQRIGPCNAKIEVQKIEDVRTSKRQFVIERAKALLRTLTEDTLPDSQELADEVAQSVRMMEVLEYGPDRLAAGPAIEESEEVIVVEGRADVLCLLKQGFRNVIGLNGTSVPQTIKDLSRRKSITAFVDGDRGGDLIIRELLSTADIDFVCKAPDGKEVEELTKKEIHKSLRGRVTAEQAKMDLGIDDSGALLNNPIAMRKPLFPSHSQSSSNGNVPPRRLESTQGGQQRPSRFQRPLPNASSPPLVSSTPRPAPVVVRDGKLNADEKKIFKQTLDDLFGTRGACIFDQKLNVLGKVPLSELMSTIKSLNGGVYALALDGDVDADLVKTAEKLGITYVVAAVSKAKDASSRVVVVTEGMLQ